MGLFDRIKKNSKPKHSEPLETLLPIYQHNEFPHRTSKLIRTGYKGKHYEKAQNKHTQLADSLVIYKNTPGSPLISNVPLAFRYEDMEEDQQPYIQPLPSAFSNNQKAFEEQKQNAQSYVSNPSIQKPHYLLREQKPYKQFHTSKSHYTSHSCNYCCDLSRFPIPPEYCPYTGNVTMDTGYIDVVKSLVDLGRPEDETADESERMRWLENRKVLWVIDSGLKAWGESMEKKPREVVKAWLGNCAAKETLGFLIEHKGYNLKEHVENEWRMAVLRQKEDDSDGGANSCISGLEQLDSPERLEILEEHMTMIRSRFDLRGSFSSREGSYG